MSETGRKFAALEDLVNNRTKATYFVYFFEELAPKYSTTAKDWKLGES